MIATTRIVKMASLAANGMLIVAIAMLISKNVRVHSQLENEQSFRSSMRSQIEQLVKDRARLLDLVDQLKQQIENSHVSRPAAIAESEDAASTTGSSSLTPKTKATTMGYLFPTEDISILNERLDFEYGIYIEQVYGGFLDSIEVGPIDRQDILEEMLMTHREYRSRPVVAEEYTNTEVFASAPAGPNYGELSFLPSFVLERYLENEHFNQFKAYQFGLNRSESKIINYLEAELLAIQNSPEN